MERAAIHKNLAALWANFAEAGAHRLIVCRVLEARSLLEQIRVAVPGADITVVRLHVPPAELHTRIRHREEGDPTWYLEAATYLVPVLGRAGVEDHAVDNTGRPARETAREVPGRIGWLLGALARTGSSSAMNLWPPVDQGVRPADREVLGVGRRCLRRPPRA